MKKKYSKPQIIFESFSMSERIAGDCEAIINFAKGTCGVPTNVPEFIVFGIGISSACNIFPPEEVYDGFCYHIPVETQNYFNS